MHRGEDTLGYRRRWQRAGAKPERWSAGLREGRLQGPACVEDIDFRATRGLDKPMIRSLLRDSDWVRRAEGQ